MDYFRSSTANLETFLTTISPKDHLLDLDDMMEIAKNSVQYYKEIKIPKKAGGFRKVYSVNGLLKSIQYNIYKILKDVYSQDSIPSCIFGFVPGKSIVDNAAKHTGKKFVINIDIKDFFGSITAREVNKFLSHKPISLHSRGYINVLISLLCTRNGVLPQGGISSPILSNIAMKNLDFAFVMLAKKNNVIYTRYADDITFSGNNNIDYHSFINTIDQKLEKHHFQINKKKSRIQYDHQRQIVTGLVVNQKVNIKSEFLAVTRSMIHNWEKFGLKIASRQFNSKRHFSEGIFFENVLRGRIDFIGSVLNHKKKENHTSYVDLNSKYWALINCVDFSFISDERVRKRLFERNMECEKIALDKGMYENQEYRFVSYCFTVFSQMEILYKYYFYLRFNRDFEKIGLFLFDSSEHVKKQFKKQVRVYSDINDRLNKARVLSAKITSLKSLSTFTIEDAFMQQSYTNKSRTFPRFFNFIRGLRNYHAHGGDFVIKQTFEEVDHDVKEIINAKNISEITLDSDPIKGLATNDQKKIHHYQFYLWYQSCPFEDVRSILHEIAYEIKVLELTKKKNAANNAATPLS